MRSLAGKVVWITGASSGIGASLAVKAHDAGARVILSGRNQSTLRAVAAECAGETKPQVLAFDLEDAAALPGIAEQAWRYHGHIDVLVHNAGVAHRDLVESTDMAVDRRVMETNFFGPIAITKALLPRMLERGQGHVLVVSSLSGKYGVPRASAYAASKHALHGWFDSLRAEVHGRGIRVTLVVPAFVDTSICRNALTGDGSLYGRQLAVHASGMHPDQCALAVLRALERAPEEVAIGGSGRASLLLARLSPGLWRWVIRNHPLRAWRRLTGVLGGIFARRGAARGEAPGAPASRRGG